MGNRHLKKRPRIRQKKTDGVELNFRNDALVETTLFLFDTLTTDPALCRQLDFYEIRRSFFDGRLLTVKNNAFTFESVKFALALLVERDLFLNDFVQKPSLDTFVNLNAVNLLLEFAYFRCGIGYKANKGVTAVLNSDFIIAELEILNIARLLRAGTSTEGASDFINYLKQQSVTYLSCATGAYQVEDYATYIENNDLGCAYRNLAQVVIETYLPQEDREDSLQLLIDEVKNL